MATKLTASIWEQRRRKWSAFAFGASLVAIVSSVAFSIIAQPDLLTLEFVFRTAGAVATAAFLGMWFCFHRTRGALLLDCGPMPVMNGRLFRLARGLMILGIALAILGAVVGVIEDGARATFLAGLSNLYLGFVIIDLALILFRGRLQIRENGIWQYFGLIPWANIGSYGWVNDCTLLIEPKGMAARKKVTLQVPSEHREAFHDALALHCPTAERPLVS